MAVVHLAKSFGDGSVSAACGSLVKREHTWWFEEVTCPECKVIADAEHVMMYVKAGQNETEISVLQTEVTLLKIQMAKYEMFKADEVSAHVKEE